MARLWDIGFDSNVTPFGADVAHQGTGTGELLEVIDRGSISAPLPWSGAGPVATTSSVQRHSQYPNLQTIVIRVNWSDIQPAGYNLVGGNYIGQYGMPAHVDASIQDAATAGAAGKPYKLVLQIFAGLNAPVGPNAAQTKNAAWVKPDWMVTDTNASAHRPVQYVDGIANDGTHVHFPVVWDPNMLFHYRNLLVWLDGFLEGTTAPFAGFPAGVKRSDYIVYIPVAMPCMQDITMVTDFGPHTQSSMPAAGEIIAGTTYGDGTTYPQPYIDDTNRAAWMTRARSVEGQTFPATDFNSLQNYLANKLHNPVSKTGPWIDAIEAHMATFQTAKAGIQFGSLYGDNFLRAQDLASLFGSLYGKTRLYGIGVAIRQGGTPLSFQNFGAYPNNAYGTLEKWVGAASPGTPLMGVTIGGSSASPPSAWQTIVEDVRTHFPIQIVESVAGAFSDAAYGASNVTYASGTLQPALAANALLVQAAGGAITDRVLHAVSKVGGTGSWLEKNAPAAPPPLKTMLGSRVITQQDYDASGNPSPGTSVPTAQWLDTVDDFKLGGRHLAFRNCFSNMDSTDSPSTWPKDLETGAWTRGEVAYVQIHARRSAPGGPGTFATGLGDVFWDATAPNIDPALFPNPQGIYQGHLDALIDAIGINYKNAANNPAYNGAPFWFCFQHEPVDDAIAQGYPDKKSGGPAFVRAFNHWKARWDAIGIPNLLGYIVTLTDAQYNNVGVVGANHDANDYYNGLSFTPIVGVDSYIKETGVYAPPETMLGKSRDYAKARGSTLFIGEWGYASQAGNGTLAQSKGQYFDDLLQWITDAGIVTAFCFQGNYPPTNPYLDYDFYSANQASATAKFLNFVNSSQMSGALADFRAVMPTAGKTELYHRFVLIEDPVAPSATATLFESQTNGAAGEGDLILRLNTNKRLLVRWTHAGAVTTDWTGTAPVAAGDVIEVRHRLSGATSGYEVRVNGVIVRSNLTLAATAGVQMDKALLGTPSVVNFDVKMDAWAADDATWPGPPATGVVTNADRPTIQYLSPTTLVTSTSLPVVLDVSANITDPDGIAQAYVSINGGSFQPMVRGGTQWHLSVPFDGADGQDIVNTVVIRAIDAHARPLDTFYSTEVVVRVQLTSGGGGGGTSTPPVLPPGDVKIQPDRFEEWSVIHEFHDGTQVGEVQPDDLRFGMYINRPGYINYSIPISHVLSTRENTEAYGTDWYLWNGDQVIFSGLHTAVDVDTDGEHIEVAGQGWLHYFERLRMPFDDAHAKVKHYPPKGPGPNTMDVFEMMEDFLSYLIRNEPNAIQFTYNNKTSGIMQSASMRARDQTSFYDTLTQFADGSPGFDFEVNNDKEFKMYAPRQGDIVDYVLELGKNVKGIHMTDSGPVANRLVGTGSGGSDQLARQVIDAASRARFRLLCDTADYGTVNNVSQLARLTLADLTKKALPGIALWVTIYPEQFEDVIKRVRVGDSVPVVADLGYDEINGYYRSVGIERYITDQGDVEIVFTFNDQE